MSRRDCPDLGSELLTAVSASLAALKTHLASADPKVSLRAASELTKLLSVCARHGLQLDSVGGTATDDTLTPQSAPIAGEQPPTPTGHAVGGTPHLSEPSRPPAPVTVPDRRPLPAHVSPRPVERESVRPVGGTRPPSSLGPPVGKPVTPGSG